jgi:hypothetical protein
VFGWSQGGGREGLGPGPIIVPGFREEKQEPLRQRTWRVEDQKPNIAHTSRGRTWSEVLFAAKWSQRLRTDPRNGQNSQCTCRGLGREEEKTNLGLETEVRETWGQEDSI